MSTKTRKNKLHLSTNHVTLWTAALQAEASGDVSKAERLFGTMLAKDPSHREAQHRLALIAHKRGNREEAEKYYEAITERGAPNAHYHGNYAGLLVEMGKYKAAKKQAVKAIEADAGYASAYLNLGAALHQSGNYDHALVAYKKAIELDPLLIKAYTNMGETLRKKDRSDLAVKCMRQALVVDPDNANSHLHLSFFLLDINENAAATTHLVEALRLDPDMVYAYNNLSEALKRLGQDDAARAAQRIAVSLNTDPKLRWNLGLLELAAGELESGWDLYDEGIVSGQRDAFVDLGLPHWDGSPLDGKRIVVLAEQGLGDEIMFASCLPDLLEHAGKYVVTCDTRLAPLFQRSFPSAEISSSRERLKTVALSVEKHFDYQIPIGSLPRYFRRSLDKFPVTPGYLKPDLDKAVTWKQRLEDLPAGLKIGINWRSSNMKVTRQANYVTLDDLLPIFSVPGLTFVNLQYDDCKNELDHLRESDGIVIHDFDDLDQFNDLDNVAALISQLDVVVCVATAVSSIAGAIGAKTLKLIPHHFWPALGTDQDPWYPNTMLFQINANSNWDKAIDKLREQLQTMLAS